MSLALFAASFGAVSAAAPSNAVALEAHAKPLPPSYGLALPTATPTALPAALPYESTFKLHSYPGAQRVIYLDFNGETIINTAWNKDYGPSIGAAAFDKDGNPGAFSTGELDIIQSVWQRVAEDFAPLAVDVTTEDPGIAALERSSESDTTYGTRALITGMSQIFNTCGCSGVAWGGVFNMWATNQYYQPAFVFSRALATDKDLADTVTHEAGHTLGLGHDGKGSDPYYFGQGAWAPTLGAGFYRPVTQFSKGDYANPTNTQDDFAVMAQHGALLRSDDYADSVVGAAPLGQSLTAKGVISTDADADVFSFTAPGGGIGFAATPSSKGPNLDIKLELLDGNGAVIASADPPSAMPNSSNYDYATGLSATVSASLAPGNHFLRVQGVGNGDPKTTGYSGYGSVGNYTITSAAAAATQLSVGDVSMNEGNSGTTGVNFTISMSAASASPVSVNVSTSDGTAGAGTDYTAANGVVTIPAGQTSATYTVDATGDVAVEPSEKFALTLSNPVGATIADGAGVATLVNDDGSGIRISDVWRSEGAKGTITTYTFTVSLSVVALANVGVTVSTANGSAIAGGTDYYAKSQVLTFLAGQRSKTFSVSVKGDDMREGNETFYVKLSNPTGLGVKILDGQGVGTIRNDD